MTNNPIIQEIHAVREKYAQQFGNNLKTICQIAQAKQETSGHKVIRLSPKLAPSASTPINT
jgi:hypothetical protein